MKEVIKGLTNEQLEIKMAGIGQPAFRGRQLFRWVNQMRESDFGKMTDMSKTFRAELSEKFQVPLLKVAEKQCSSDGTIKYLVQLEDGQKVETVFIPKPNRNTLCVSTQVGCKMGCTFCATAYQGFTRNLKSWEIVDQLFCIDTPEPITNIVLMGMGEPLDNYDEVISALRIFQDPNGPKIGKRHITLSTVGLTSKIQRFVDENVGNIAISLHGTTNEQRSKIMPVNRKYPIEGLMEVCRGLRFRGQRRVTFEYILIKDFNDSEADAHRLAKLVNGTQCKINLLAYNENPFVDYKRPEEDVVLRFQNILLSKNLTATYRRSRGRDIAAACGQLRTEERLRKKVAVSSPTIA